MALWKGGPHVSQSVHCRVIVVKDVKCIIGFSHERLFFVIHAVTIELSRGISVDQFEDEMSRVSEYHYLTEIFSD